MEHEAIPTFSRSPAQPAKGGAFLGETTHHFFVLLVAHYLLELTVAALLILTHPTEAGLSTTPSTRQDRCSIAVPAEKRAAMRFPLRYTREAKLSGKSG